MCAILAMAWLGLACTTLFPGSPPPQDCFWTEAYGDGSAPFEERVRQELDAAAISGTVQTSSYGERNSCDNAFHANALDVEMEIQAADLGDAAALADVAAKIDPILESGMTVSDVPNLGQVRLKFVATDGSGQCWWDFDLEECDTI